MEGMIMRVLINTVVMFVSICGLCLSVFSSQQDSLEERAKRERKHAEIDKLTKIVARQVRDNEKDWGFQGRSRGSSSPDKDKKSIVYVIDSWKNGDDAVEVHAVLHDLMNDAKKSLRSYAASLATGPEKEEKITGIGDQALLLECPDNSQLIFSKGTHFVSVLVKTSDSARSTETAKRFAKYYDQAIVSAK
jgi:hypothetical protein